MLVGSNKNNIGVSLLESCFFDIRDSLLLGQHLCDLQVEKYDGGRRPSMPFRTKRRLSNELRTAQRFGQYILEHGVFKNEKDWCECSWLYG